MKAREKLLGEANLGLAVAPLGAFPAKAHRARYAVLKSNRSKDYGVKCSGSWHENLRSYLILAEGQSGRKPCRK
jgi:hypothetical protein